MTTVSSATATTSSSSSSTASAAANISSDYQMFLQMLTTQMQNQDPTNPIDSTDYAAQLAAFSQVEQQVQTNELLTSLVTQLGLMGMSEYAGWVGMEARAAVPAYYDGTNAVTLAPNPVVGADQTVLVVSDESGNEVSRQTIPVSTDTIDWDGTDSNGNALSAGLYSFSLESYNSGSLLSTDTVDTYNRIVEAQGTSDGAVLVLRGGTTVGTGEISALREAD
ncbi:MAG: flagellar hook capping FlgD N-terminal domain-containing protein [Paenirhodobacter sp.]|uniref:flagellar hook capping FlgD N-terminal domain-containing protein n=1 Tax=Paenirhodobacter sp. TaxID=1965326 RepID=UPI003D138F55